MSALAEFYTILNFNFWTFERGRNGRLISSIVKLLFLKKKYPLWMKNLRKRWRRRWLPFLPLTPQPPSISDTDDSMLEKLLNLEVPALTQMQRECPIIFILTEDIIDLLFPFKIVIAFLGKFYFAWSSFFFFHLVCLWILITFYLFFFHSSSLWFYVFGFFGSLLFYVSLIIHIYFKNLIFSKQEWS